MCQYFSATVDNVAKKIDYSAIRLAKLQELVRDRFGGIQSDLAIAAGRNPTQVNHWFTGHRKPNGDTPADQ